MLARVTCRLGQAYTPRSNSHLSHIRNRADTLAQKRSLVYLEEETLSAAAFDFTVSLPHLSHLGVQDVPLTEVELAELRRRLPDVGVS